jgi:hypothetical protein
MSWSVSALQYPGADILNALEFEGSANVLMETEHDPSRVWQWYGKRLGIGTSSSALGRRDLEAGRVLMGTRRTARVLDYQSPFSPNEQPQVMVLQQGAKTLTIVLSRATEKPITRIMVFLLVPA